MCFYRQSKQQPNSVCNVAFCAGVQDEVYVSHASGLLSMMKEEPSANACLTSSSTALSSVNMWTVSSSQFHVIRQLNQSNLQRLYWFIFD
uniref:Ovule protein n=1 Tax=Echinococcus granulosus TaxID=6210 RepID=A0A068W6Q2_ECHGR|nr:hypothetical protein EgrG_002011800 [Echinococcus granulosus]